MLIRSLGLTDDSRKRNQRYANFGDFRDTANGTPLYCMRTQRLCWPSYAVYDSISDYLDHQVEIDQELTKNRMEALIAEYNLTFNHRGFVCFSPKMAVE